ncbi:MAG: hypothetical protein ACK2T6_03785, partial [Anaerolineae bacterium]
MPSKRAWFVLLAIPLIVLLSTAAATSAPASQIPDSDQIRTAAESGMAAGGDAPIAADFDGAGEAATPLQMLAQMADAPPSAKLAPALRAADAGQGNDRLLIVVVSAAPVDLSGFAERVHSFTWPAGEYVSMLRARSSDLLDIAALDGVAQVTSGEVDLLAQPGGPVQIPSELLAAPLAGAEVDGVPASELASAGAAPGDPVARRDGDGGEGDLLGWHDALEGHSAAEAWAMGYRGEGVLVGVLDTGVDFAHQDLQGTWRTLPDGHAYEGWPQVYDPTSAYLYATARAVDDDTELLRSALGGLIEMYQESEVSEEDRDGETVNTACFQPLLGPLNGTDRTLADEACDFVVPNSKGGVVRFGHHPDRNLAGIRSPGGPPATRVGEFVGVLLVDANEAGTFDTVYVDLDSDHDF